MHTGCEKLNIAKDGCKLMLQDRSEIDEDVDIMLLSDSIFILVGKDQCVNIPSVSAPVYPSTSRNTSKTFQRTAYTKLCD